MNSGKYIFKKPTKCTSEYVICDHLEICTKSYKFKNFTFLLSISGFLLKGPDFFKSEIHLSRYFK